MFSNSNIMFRNLCSHYRSLVLPSCLIKHLDADHKQPVEVDLAANVCFWPSCLRQSCRSYRRQSWWWNSWYVDSVWQLENCFLAQPVWSINWSAECQQTKDWNIRRCRTFVRSGLPFRHTQSGTGGDSLESDQRQPRTSPPSHPPAAFFPSFYPPPEISGLSRQLPTFQWRLWPLFSSLQRSESLAALTQSSPGSLP